MEYQWFVGIDWATEKNDVCLIDAAGGALAFLEPIQICSMQVSRFVPEELSIQPPSVTRAGEKTLAFDLN